MGIILGYAWFELVHLFIIVTIIAGTARPVKPVVVSIVDGYPSGYV